VRFVEYTPYIWAEAECMWEYLKDDIALRQSIATAPKGREAQRV